jgi:hypothetical protein
MINSISSGQSFLPPRAEQNLTDEQKNLISETLSNFDPDNLSEADALTIIETFSQAGITPSKALETSMSEFGFDAKGVGELANESNVDRRPPPPPQQGAEDISSMVDYLDELLEQKLAESNSSLSDEDKQLILAKVFEKYGVGDETSIVNTVA